MNQLRKTNRISRVLAALTLAAWLAAFTASAPSAAPANTYTVMSLANSGAWTLREAITQANAHAGPDTIVFSLPPCAPVCTIALTTALPYLTDGGTTIDGFTQPGSSPATDDSPATIVVEIDGHLITGVAHGLGITSAGNTIRGLAINRFNGDGVAISGTGATGNVIAGNHIGVTPSAGLTMGNLLDGVFIGNGAADNTVGGKSHAERNIIGGNGWDGVGIHGSGSDRNVISFNYIGTNGTDPLGNNLSGVRIYGGAKGNIVGGNEAVERNLISGNGRYGVIISGDTAHNIITGNRIGVNPDGTSALGNAFQGVLLGGGAHHNRIGGANTTPGGRAAASAT